LILAAGLYFGPPAGGVNLGGLSSGPPALPSSRRRSSPPRRTACVGRSGCGCRGRCRCRLRSQCSCSPTLPKAGYPRHASGSGQRALLSCKRLANERSATWQPLSSFAGTPAPRPTLGIALSGTSCLLLAEKVLRLHGGGHRFEPGAVHHPVYAQMQGFRAVRDLFGTPRNGLRQTLNAPSVTLRDSPGFTMVSLEREELCGTRSEPGARSSRFGEAPAARACCHGRAAGSSC